MHNAVKVAGFALGLAALFGAAVGIGAAVGPDTAAAAGEPHSPDTVGGPMNTAAMAATGTMNTAEVPGGLMISQDGYSLTLGDRSLPAGPSVPLRFQILGPDGNPVTGYQTAHDKDLHLIVVRRDLSGFQHVHPTLAPDGTWSVPVDLSAAGQYRVFADFTPTGHDGGITLGADLAVPGVYNPEPLPAPSPTADLVDGYRVTLDGRLAAGRESELTLSVSKAGFPVTDLQPYLAAYGHLVTLRSGDLAYLHVHPAGEPGDGVTPAGPGITFYATAPSAGDYRLFLDFQHNGVVRTAAFTVHAEESPGAAAPSTSPAPGTDGHGH